MTDHKHEHPGPAPRKAAASAVESVTPIYKRTAVTPKGLSRDEAREIILAILG